MRSTASDVDSDSSSENTAMRTPITTKGPLMISSPVGQPSLPNVGTGIAVPAAVADAAWAVGSFASDYILPVIGDGKSQSAPLFILGVQLSGLLGSVASSIDASANITQRKEKLRLCLSNCLILKVSFFCVGIARLLSSFPIASHASTYCAFPALETMQPLYLFRATARTSLLTRNCQMRLTAK